MKILVFAKRRPQGRDLIRRPYGRFHFLPSELRNRGHSVKLVVADYSGAVDEQTSTRGMSIISVGMRSARGLGRYITYARAAGSEVRPDWVGGLSDTWYALAAQHVARRCGARLWIDAYDNYSSYIPWAWPLHRAWRKAARQADLLTVAGPTLEQLLGSERTASSTLVLPMAPDPIGFEPGDMLAARARLRLPGDAPLVAFGGGVHPSRDLETLFRAVEIARRQCPQLKLVLSGRRFRGVELPADALWLGYLPDDAIPTLYQAVDVVAVMNTPGAFGDYSYPIKLYEAMACKRPVVVSRTASTAWILRDHPQRLVEPNNPKALANILHNALTEKKAIYSTLPTWSGNTDILEAALSQPLQACT